MLTEHKTIDKMSNVCNIDMSKTYTGMYGIQ